MENNNQNLSDLTSGLSFSTIEEKARLKKLKEEKNRKKSIKNAKTPQLNKVDQEKWWLKNETPSNKKTFVYNNDFIKSLFNKTKRLNNVFKSNNSTTPNIVNDWKPRKIPKRFINQNTRKQPILYKPYDSKIMLIKNIDYGTLLKAYKFWIKRDNADQKDDLIKNPKAPKTIDMQQVQQEAEEIIKDAKDKSYHLLINSFLEIQTQRQNMISKTRKDINKQNLENKQWIDQKRKEAEKEIKQQIIIIATRLAEKFVSNAIDNKSNQELIRTFIDSFDMDKEMK